MTVFRCKMCGGALEIQEGMTVCECEYCGTTQTLPHLDDQKANLYDRANHFRRNNEYDKAMTIYERILEVDTHDAEAYWSLVLCKYGIEYVEDPQTRRRVPTVNRAQFTSVFADEDYKSAIQYADGYQRAIYEAEAKTIDEIQKGILAISKREEPFDVFICYKETGDDGRRTKDSVIAMELYRELTREGFKVFFSRVTLEDKVGTAYEPYIFAALNSAKAMVVIGTKPEYFNAVWVKNEWSRYLALIKNGARKTLIPAYRDMDPYDLPEEFSHLQALDMSRLGFMPDLIHGVKKIVEIDQPKQTVEQQTSPEPRKETGNTSALLKRAFLFMEDGDFSNANGNCEKVLNQDPENGEAYLIKLMIDLGARRRADLANANEPFENNANYQKAMRFGDEKLKLELQQYIVSINMRKQENAYAYAVNETKKAQALEKTAADVKVGSRITLDPSDPRAISWIVLDKQGDRAFIISEQILLMKEYNKEKKPITWNNSTLREFLNNRFYTSALSDMERACVMSMKAAKGYEISADASDSNSEDKIYLLSEREAKKYFATNGKRVAKDSTGRAGRWWLRSQGASAFDAKCVEKNGEIVISGSPVSQQNGVRPALWINLGSLNLLRASKHYNEAAKLFSQLGDYKKSKEFITACQTKAKAARETTEKGKMYAEAKAKMVPDKQSLTEAIALFKKIGNYKDAEKLIAECEKQIYQIDQAQMMQDEKINKQNKTLLKWVAGIAAVIALSLLAIYVVIPVAGNLSQSAAYSQAAKNYENIMAHPETAKVGDPVAFGTNGSVPIMWRILEIKDNKMLVISDKVLYSAEYNESYTNITWADCTLRANLNGDFYNKSFKDAEKAKIATTHVVNGNNMQYGTPGGADTDDKIFLLSIDEANQYFKSDNDRVSTNSKRETSWWWLRNPGYTSNYAAGVSNDGKVFVNGYNVRNNNGVRPALWLNL